MFWQYYKKQQRKQRNKIFVFSLLSAFISAVAALLLTPKTGKDMRKTAVEKAKEAADKLKVLGEDTGKKVTEFGSSIGEKIEGTKQKAGDTTSSIRSRALDAGEKFIQKLRESSKHGEEVEVKNLSKTVDSAKKDSNK